MNRCENALHEVKQNSQVIDEQFLSPEPWENGGLS